MEIHKAEESVPIKKNKEIKTSGERKATPEVSEDGSSLSELENGDLNKDPMIILKEPVWDPQDVWPVDWKGPINKDYIPLLNFA